MSPVKALFERRDPFDSGLWAMSKITELNDHFRITLDQRLGTVMFTDAVATRHFTVQMSVMEAVKTFNAFTQDNDGRAASTTSGSSRSVENGIAGKSTIAIQLYIFARRSRLILTIGPAY